MSLEDEKKRWEEKTLQPVLNRAPERKSEFCTPSGILEPRLLVPAEDDNYMEKLGFPGEFPFTRGVQPNMYRGRFWTMRQYAGFSTAEESNQRYRYLLGQGQTGLSVAFDLPTQVGYDPDHPLAHGEVGKVGVSVCTLSDMESLLQGIPLDKVSTSMTINAPAAILLAMYIAVARRQGAAESALRGTIQNDILKEYVARGTYIFPPAPSMRLITDIFQYCERNVPHWNTISISGYHIREAGSTAIQEVAFTIADAIAYVEAAVKVGLKVDAFAAQLSFFFNANNNLFEEVAKYRAARRMWAKIMRGRFGSQDPRSQMMRFHTQTAGSALTAQQPENNVVRVTLQALSAVLGGTQSLHTNSMDEALWLPTEKSVRTALRTQQILAYESGVADTVDPLAGSYLVEHLTDEIERRAMEYIQKIDDLGGALNAIENGYMQNEIQEAAYQAQRELETRVQTVVGVNAFQVEETLSLESQELNCCVEEAQTARLAELREQRDASRASELLTRLENGARGSENMMPLFIQAVEADLTLGEVCGVLRGVWGEYQAPSLG